MPAQDIVFYFDVSSEKGVVSNKAINAQVKKFINQTEKIQPNSNWGVVVFREGEDNPSFLESLVEDDEAIDLFLKDHLKFTAKSHPIEQGLMLATSYLVEAYRMTGGHVLRVIVISDGPTEGSNVDLVNALMNLLETIKYFPVYIDIIRVGDQRVYPDDVKLEFIKSATDGTLNYADSDSSFKKIMGELFSLQRQPPEKLDIPEKYRDFYEGLCFNLAKSSAIFKCGFCMKEKDPTKGGPVYCMNCGEHYHLRCAEYHANNEYEGFRGIFRCVRCGVLLKMNVINEPSSHPASQGGSSIGTVEDDPVRIEMAPEVVVDSGESPGGEATTTVKKIVFRATGDSIDPSPDSAGNVDIKIIDSETAPVTTTKNGNPEGITVLDNGKNLTPRKFWKRKKEKN
ncbi:MAG: hypothetical protein ACTSUE_20330 [Promethearchaeota archaeon]